jgi:hypothetical protein
VIFFLDFEVPGWCILLLFSEDGGVEQPSIRRKGIGFISRLSSIVFKNSSLLYFVYGTVRWVEDALVPTLDVEL